MIGLSDGFATAPEHGDINRTLMRTTGTTRDFTGADVPDHVLFEAFDAARFAPQGGNRQPVRWIVVRDKEAKAALGELYLPRWKAYLNVSLGSVPLESAPQAVRDADRFAHEFASIPVVAVACAHVPSLLATDEHLDRMSVVAGASIYPTCRTSAWRCGRSVWAARSPRSCARPSPGCGSSWPSPTSS